MRYITPLALLVFAGTTRAQFHNGEYLRDDGIAENTIGLVNGGAFGWMQRYVIAPDKEIITSIRAAFGTPTSINGRAVTAYLWSDPNGDGSPADAQVLAQRSGVVSGASATVPITFPTFVTFDIPDVVRPRGTNFFVGVIMQNQLPQERPAPVDQTLPLPGPGIQWAAYAGTNSLDPNMLQNVTDLAPLAGLSGDWLIRADAASLGLRYYVGPDGGHWLQPLAWSNTSGGPGGASVPGLGGSAFITGSISKTVTFNDNHIPPAGNLSYLIVDGTSNATMTLSQPANILVAGSQTIGEVGRGVYLHSGGTNRAATVIRVGAKAGSSGTYSLGGTGMLIVEDLRIAEGGAATFLQSGGTLNATATRINGNGTFSYTAGGMNAGNLSLNGGGKLLLGTGSNKVVRSTSLTIDTAMASTIDLADNAMIVDYSDSSPLETVRSYLVSGYADGSWNGNGVNSSSAATTAGHALGYAESTAIFSSFPATFAGQHVDDTAVLVRYTLSGDADLDLMVNLNDFNRLATNFGQMDKHWWEADFTFDGVVDLNDFNCLAANFGLTAGPDGPTPQDWAALASTVPEPGVGTCLLIGLALLRRARRAAPRADACTDLRERIQRKPVQPEG